MPSFRSTFTNLRLEVVSISLPLQLLFLSALQVAGGSPQILQEPFIVQSYTALSGSSWPPPSAWTDLNSTLGGRLQALRPWTAACYTDDPLYDPVECETVSSNYTNHHTRESIPSALIWANWEGCGYNGGCGLSYSNPQSVSGEMCHQGSIPPYSTAISNAQDASDIVNWATIHGVTLTIRNTGHDYLGRSSRPHSLQVFTRNLDSVEYIADFVPQGSLATPVPAIKIGAGARLDAIYSITGANNVSAVLGSCLTVGAAGGYIQGGGIGPLSPTFGLASDNILEVEIVTADGVVRTINSVQDSDLFWAVRGGGGGSWGIVISATIAALPPTTISISMLMLTPNPSQSLKTLGVNFIALVGKYQDQIVNAGITSYLDLSESSYTLAFIWPGQQASVALLYPLFEEIRALSDDYTVLVNQTQEHLFPSISAAAEEMAPYVDDRFYGAAIQIGSRFIPRTRLENPKSIHSVAEAVWDGLEIVTALIRDEPAGSFRPAATVSLVGEMPATRRQQVNDTGVNPAFYDAAWLVTYRLIWPDAIDGAYRAMVQAVYEAVGPLTSIGLTSSYLNEASILEKNWQEAFFGYKYDRLLDIKRKYDPTNFFTTYKGVGYTGMESSEVYSCYPADDRD